MSITWNPEQIKAIEEIRTWIASPGGGAKSLTGPAGSGKTSLVQEIKKSMPGATAWTAMTGKAALRLAEAAGVHAKTLHATLYKPPRARGRILDFADVRKPECKVILVDEASMATPKIHKDLGAWMQQGVKVLYVGDGYQLPPILSQKEESEHGSDFIVFREVAGPALTKVMRSGDGIIDVADYIRVNQKIPEVGNASVKIERVAYPGLTAIEDFLADRDDHALITWTNKLRMVGNAEVRRRLGKKQPLPEAGEPVLIRKNGQDLLNGEVVIADSFEPGPMLGEVKTMWMTISDGRTILVSTNGKDQFMDGLFPNIKDWRGYHEARNAKDLDEPLPITYGYVYTAHLAQGSQYRRVSVYLSGSDLYNEHFNKPTKLHTGETTPFSARFLYTASSRPTSQLTIYTS